MKNYKESILSLLIDKFERSKSFIGDNKVSQSFSIQLSKAFPEYSDDSNIQEIKAIETAISDLTDAGFIKCKKQKSGVISSVALNDEAIDAVYRFLKRKPKKDTNSEIVELLNAYSTKNELLAAYCSKQLERIAANKSVEHFKGDLKEYKQILTALAEIFNVTQETFQRDFSVKVFGDSKAFEKIRGTVVSILNDYGDFPDKETILEDLNIVSNPGHVFIKGCGTISICGQTINLDSISGDIAFSSALIKSIDSIKVTSRKVITIENLTSFNAYIPNNELVIYLGGYHNSIRRAFIKMLYELNPDKQYYHFGDIDAGGFFILLHLRKKTGVPFAPLHMDINTLIKYDHYTKKLTESDRARLKNLEEGEFSEVVSYMLEHNRKLEQESLDRNQST